MPVHDWTRVDDGLFHHFHNAWVLETCAALNEHVLPTGYYALTEQVVSDVVPDVLALHSASDAFESDLPGMTSLALAPPEVELSASLEQQVYAGRQKRIAVRKRDDNRVVALMEFVSRGNKAATEPFREFLDKVASALWQGIHVLIADLYPPTARDPHGLPAAIWARLGDDAEALVSRKPLTLSSFEAGPAVHAFVQSVNVGDTLPSMPLFLQRGYYVSVPLEETYSAALRFVPATVRSELDSTTS